MGFSSILRLVLFALWLGLGIYYLVSARDLAVQPRRGTSPRFGRRGYRVIGVIFLVLAAGQVALLSQSGAICTSILDWAREAHVGFSVFVSVLLPWPPARRGSAA